MPFDGIVTRAVTNELQEKLLPGKITKIYQPTNYDLLLTIRSKGENHSLLLSVHPSYARFHLTEQSYQNPAEPPMFCMVLRKHLQGAILEHIEQKDMERIVTFTMKTRNEIGDISDKLLIFELMGKHSNIILVDREKEQIVDSIKHISYAQNRHRAILPGQPYISPPSQNKLHPLHIDEEQFIRRLDFNRGKLHLQIVEQVMGFSPFLAKEIVERAKLGSPDIYGEKFAEIQQQIARNEYVPAIYQNGKEDFHVIPLTFITGNIKTFTCVNEMLDTFYANKADRDYIRQQAKDLYRFIANERKKNEKKLIKHQQTLKKAEDAEHYQKLGELLTAHLHLVSPGDKQVKVIDYYDPEQKEVTIELDPQKSPSENAQQFFKSYQKLKNSKRIVKQEIEKTEKELLYFDQLLQQIDAADLDDLEEIREELQEEGYLKKRQRDKKGKKKTALPKPETYKSSDGTIILVGKNNKQNEYLTMKLARRDEIWLHTKDIPGSHVIIRSTEPSEKTLLEAAQLAAYFSKAKQSSSVPVDYTRVRHVKKPKGAKPGFVIYDQQKTVFVTPSKELADSLKIKASQKR